MRPALTGGILLLIQRVLSGWHSLLIGLMFAGVLRGFGNRVIFIWLGRVNCMAKARSAAGLGAGDEQTGSRPAVVYQAGRVPYPQEDRVLEEAPFSVVINGQPYAVMMLTPGDYEDFLYGFLYAEGLINGVADVLDWEPVESFDGCAAYVQLSEGAAHRARNARRSVTGGSGCGLCGVPVFEGLMSGRPLLVSPGSLSVETIHAVLRQMQARQSLNRSTGTAHAAILASSCSAIVREDIGRHNAVDKVIGSAIRQGWQPGQGLMLGVSSRLTFEIVQKALRFQLPVVAAISGVSTMAIRVAEAGGLSAVAYVRESRMTVYTHKERIGLA